MSATAVVSFDTFNSEFDYDYRPLNYRKKEKPSTYNDNALKEGYTLKVRQSQIREFLHQNPFIRNLKEKVFSTTIPLKWHAENVEDPNYICKQTASDVAVKLYTENKIFPERIGASIEGGMMLHYVNYINDKTLSIEIDNNLEIAAIVNQRKTILKSADIFNMNFKDVIREYAS